MTGEVVALREELAKADCSRRKVAAVIMKDGKIVGRGHNRLPEGSCLDGQCPRGKLSYAQQPKDVGYTQSGCVSVHAEVAALHDAGLQSVDATLFVTEVPCPDCQVVIIECGISRVRLLHPDRIGKFQAPV